NGRIVTGKADVVRQRVEPDISHELFVEGQLNAPIEPRLRPRDAQVAANPLDCVAQLRLSEIGNDCVLAIADVAKQPVLMLAELEIIIFFLAKLDLSPLRSELAVGSAFLVG